MFVTQPLSLGMSRSHWPFMLSMQGGIYVDLLSVCHVKVHFPESTEITSYSFLVPQLPIFFNISSASRFWSHSPADASLTFVSLRQWFLFMQIAIIHGELSLLTFQPFPSSIKFTFTRLYLRTNCNRGPKYFLKVSWGFKLYIFAPEVQIFI